MMNRRLVSYQLRKIADKIEKKNKKQIIINLDERNNEDVKNFNGEVIFIYNDDEMKCKVTGLNYSDNTGKVSGKTLDTDDEIYIDDGTFFFRFFKNKM